MLRALSKSLSSTASRSNIFSMSCPRVLTRAHIKGLIAQGQLIVISDKQVLRLDDWMERHPGGRLPILHMVGKDATDQILVLSLPSSSRVSL
jgi:sphingolipid 8-(E)-desaturase